MIIRRDGADGWMNVLFRRTRRTSSELSSTSATDLFSIVPRLVIKSNKKNVPTPVPPHPCAPPLQPYFNPHNLVVQSHAANTQNFLHLNMQQMKVNNLSASCLYTEARAGTGLEPVCTAELGLEHSSLLASCSEWINKPVWSFLVVVGFIWSHCFSLWLRCEHMQMLLKCHLHFGGNYISEGKEIRTIKNNLVNDVMSFLEGLSSIKTHLSPTAFYFRAQIWNLKIFIGTNPDQSQL